MFQRKRQSSMMELGKGAKGLHNSPTLSVTIQLAKLRFTSLFSSPFFTPTHVTIRQRLASICIYNVSHLQLLWKVLHTSLALVCKYNYEIIDKCRYAYSTSLCVVVRPHWPRELVYHLQVDTLLIAGKLASINFITITQDLCI